MNLSEHFTLAEMCHSDYGVRHFIDNVPNELQVEALRTLCENVLQPLREALGKPIKVNSGYRSPEINVAIGGSKNSQHMRGEAADITIKGMTVQELFDYVRMSSLPVDQIIQEFDRWVHVSHSYAGAQRGQFLYAKTVDGETVYSKA